uniref:Uncharacterized protein n=1 Tax=Timema tahoe TaxID=61484 RepID=A0A7R9FJ69_9NEOP|nr:unnamed protein product [Timema tahoe]
MVCAKPLQSKPGLERSVYMVISGFPWDRTNQCKPDIVWNALDLRFVLVFFGTELTNTNQTVWNTPVMWFGLVLFGTKQTNANQTLTITLVVCGMPIVRLQGIWFPLNKSCLLWMEHTMNVSVICDRDEQQGYFGPVPELPVTKRRGTSLLRTWYSVYLICGACLTSTMKCENEEDNERSEIFSLSIAVSTLRPSSVPFIKEEIKNEPDYDSTQLKLESTIEPVLHYIIKPETTSKSPTSGVCEELGVKEELCFDKSSIDVRSCCSKYSFAIRPARPPKGRLSELDRISASQFSPHFSHHKCVQLQAFLGLINDYRKFVKHHSDLVLPLLNLTKKNDEWNWEVQRMQRWKILNSNLRGDDPLETYGKKVRWLSFVGWRVRKSTQGEAKLLFECLSSTMKCEYNEEDNERSDLLPLSIAESTLKPSSLPFIKEEIKNEPDYHATQLKLECTIDSVLHSVIKPEKTSNTPAGSVCEEISFKEELCFDESSNDEHKGTRLLRTCYSTVCDRDEEQGYFGPVPTLHVTETQGAMLSRTCYSTACDRDEEQGSSGPVPTLPVKESRETRSNAKRKHF